MVIGRAISPMFRHDQSRLLIADGKIGFGSKKKSYPIPVRLERTAFSTGN